jgi:hypothetical protein
MPRRVRTVPARCLCSRSTRPGIAAFTSSYDPRVDCRSSPWWGATTDPRKFSGGQSPSKPFLSRPVLSSLALRTIPTRKSPPRKTAKGAWELLWEGAPYFHGSFGSLTQLPYHRRQKEIAPAHDEFLGCGERGQGHDRDRHPIVSRSLRYRRGLVAFRMDGCQPRFPARLRRMQRGPA